MHQRLGIFTAASVALGAQCAFAAPSPADMTLGALTAPPVGYVEFCQSQPRECPEASRASAGFDQTYWMLAFNMARSPQSATRVRPGPPSALRGVGRAERAQAYVGPFATNTPAADNAPKVALSSTLWTQLNRVNNQVNRRLVSMPDRTNYGVEDRWALPITDGDGRGDCEDYVLEKRRALLHAGLPQSALSIALVRTRWDEIHAVLLVETDRGTMVLDSLSSKVSHWSALDYRWLVRQSPDDPANWVEVKNRSRLAAG
ncbi:MAG: transglutaminase-like cysteine peptidase [Phenylobacterium sp.]|uniref:transglutaminase-like cysteine peptidase n=1 Tax=Phenylobacterium sp. TaxID=1871053 RepID=UPI0027353417|nr:transglutaminase-like cysteine peptidase [Phenylobacterium sp.]MDP3175123.1 transglutaminase-like cysteine peptidase [Phenylobacterium sp.]